jgi:hypothetical protein
MLIGLDAKDDSNSINVVEIAEDICAEEELTSFQVCPAHLLPRRSIQHVNAFQGGILRFRRLL